MQLSVLPYDFAPPGMANLPCGIACQPVCPSRTSDKRLELGGSRRPASCDENRSIVQIDNIVFGHRLEFDLGDHLETLTARLRYFCWIVLDLTPLSCTQLLNDMKHPNGTEPYQARTASDSARTWQATPDVDSNTISANEGSVIAPFDVNNSHAARKHQDEIQALLSKLKTAQADLRASESRLKGVEVENMQLKEGCVRLQAALKTSNEQLQDATQRLRIVTQVSSFS
eukprot:765512-Hanusia_phi.AAC.7